MRERIIRLNLIRKGRKKNDIIHIPQRALHRRRIKFSLFINVITL